MAESQPRGLEAADLCPGQIRHVDVEYRVPRQGHGLKLLEQAAYRSASAGKVAVLPVEGKVKAFPLTRFLREQNSILVHLETISKLKL